MNKPARDCVFVNEGRTNHQICVAELGVAATRQDWQESYETKAYGLSNLQCIPIEKYDPFARYLLPFDYSGSGGFRWGGILTTQFHAKCTALPASVLDSDFAKKMIAGNDLATKGGLGFDYKISGSSNYNGGKTKTKYVTSDRSRKVRDAIEKICEICPVQAPNEKAKGVLTSKCDSILKLRPTEEPFEPFAIAKKKRPLSTSGTTLSEEEEHIGNGFTALMLISFFLNIGAMVALYRLRCSTPTSTENSHYQYLSA